MTFSFVNLIYRIFGYRKRFYKHVRPFPQPDEKELAFIMYDYELREFTDMESMLFRDSVLFHAVASMFFWALYSVIPN